MKEEERLKVIKLRRKGMSYREIEKLVVVSKDSIRRWCAGVQLTDKQKDRLNLARILGQKKAARNGGLANKKKSLERKDKVFKKGYEKTKKELTVKERFLVGVTLYMAEGTKVGSGVEFTNSDPGAVEFMVDWLERYCGVSRKNLKFSLWLHENLSETEAKLYWCDLLKIVENQFGKTYFAKVRGTRKSNYHKFGIIKIRYYNVDCLNQIKGWIEGVFRGN